MTSNMGGFNLDAFYVTRSKKDIKTGFCLDVKDVTSERVIGLMPEIGQIMPMIGSIKGLLNCEIAATAALDTTMSIMTPTVNGIVRMSGKDLSISDDELYTSVARKLLFRNKPVKSVNCYGHDFLCSCIDIKFKFFEIITCKISGSFDELVRQAE